MRAIKFFKENSYNVVKVFINQIGITIFSFVLYFSIASFKENNMQLYHKLMIAISAFAMLFFFVLLYTSAWDLGAADKIRIESKKAEKNIFSAFLLSPSYICIFSRYSSLIFYIWITYNHTSYNIFLFIYI